MAFRLDRFDLGRFAAETLAEDLREGGDITSVAEGDGAQAHWTAGRIVLRADRTRAGRKLRLQ